jgi:WD40 repeat protein
MGKELRRWSDLPLVAAIEFAPRGDRFAVAVPQEGRVYLGDPESDTPLKALPGEAFGAADMAFDSTGERLAVVTMPVESGMSGESFSEMRPPRSSVYLWDVASPQEPKQVALACGGRSLTFGRDASWITVSGIDNHVSIVEPATGAVIQRLVGHKQPAEVAPLADGRIASISDDDQLKVWKIAATLDRTTECTQCSPPRAPTIELPHDPQVSITQVRFSRDGALAAVGGQKMLPASHPLRIVSATTGEPRQIGEHLDTIRSVAIRPEVKHIASVAQDQQLSVWSPNGTLLFQKPHPNKVMKVVYSRDGKLIATSTAFDGLAYLWDAETGEEKRRIQVEPGTAFALAFDADGKQLITGGLSGAIKVWDVETGALVREWAGHEGTIQTIVLSHNGRGLASCGHDQTVKLWRFETGELVRTLEGFAGPAWDCAFSPDDALLAVGAHDPVVRVFQVRDGAVVKELPDHGQGVWGLAFSPDGMQLACCGRESPLVVWDWREANKICTQPLAGECLAWWPSGAYVVTGSVVQPPKFGGVITLHEPFSGALVDTVTVPDVARAEFDLSPDARYVVVARQDGVAVVWDRQTGSAVAECRGHEGEIRGVAFHPEGEQFATAGQDGTIRFWSLQGSELAKWTQPGPATCLAFDPTGQRLATGDPNRNAYLWDASNPSETTSPLRTLEGHDGELCGLSFSGDGRWLAATSRNPANDGWTGDLKVWEVATGRRVLAIPSHTWWDASVAFHPTLPYVATTGRDHTLQMFHAQTGQLLLSIPTSGHLANTMAFSPDGRRLLAQVAGTAKLIDPTPEAASFGK